MTSPFDPDLTRDKAERRAVLSDWDELKRGRASGWLGTKLVGV